jgi:hypothetical protein
MSPIELVELRGRYWFDERRDWRIIYEFTRLNKTNMGLSQESSSLSGIANINCRIGERTTRENTTTTTTTSNS